MSARKRKLRLVPDVLLGAANLLQGQEKNARNGRSLPAAARAEGGWFGI